jgi:hypothetical protein
MHNFSGGCHCGNIHLDIGLPRAPVTYNPRACDCEFCVKHGAAYLSDNQGSLSIQIKDVSATRSYRQGSGIAECLLCTDCGVLVGALFRVDGQVYGTVNVRAIDAAVTFGEAQAVSPKQLGASDKTKRWTDIWFPNVRM